jgi:basic membrane protein A
MVKRVDLVAYDSFKAALDGSWRGGLSVLGLKEAGVDWALDDDNAKLVTPAMKEAVERAKRDIIAGTIVVHDYMADDACRL